MEQLNEMLYNGVHWFDVMRFVFAQPISLYDDLMARVENGFMEDEETEESQDDYHVLERMWSKIVYRIEYCDAPVKEMYSWIAVKYATYIIGPVTYHELWDRLELLAKQRNNVTS